MKVLFISGWGASVPLAMHMQEDGHEIRFWIQDKDSKDVGDGFVRKVDDYKDSVAWSDYVVCDDTHFGKVNDGIRAQGKPVVGGSALTDQLEEERGAGQRLFKAVGLSTLDSKEFKSIEEAISYVQDNPRPYVVKVSGTAQNDKTSTYVGEMDDGSDIVPVLNRMAAKMEKGVSGVEVQEKISGLEVGVGGIFNGKRFVGPCEVDWEHKKLMSWHDQQGIGPNTGEMGTVACWMDQSIPLFKKIVQPMAKPLAAMGFHGFFNINCIVADGKIYPLEMTNRFGWPTLPMELETMKDNDLGEFFYDVACGHDADFDVSLPWSVCVVIGVPPLPYMNDEIYDKFSRDMPVMFREGVPEGLYPGECKIVDGQWLVAGSSGCLAVAAAGGHSIEECRQMAYEIADQVIVPNKMVRDDIGRTTQEAYDQLTDMRLLGNDLGKAEKRRPVVIKAGGIYLDDPKEREKMVKDLIKLAEKEKVMLVHGGGDEISRQMEAKGREPEYHDGRRYTEPKDIELVENTLRNINHDLVKELNEKGLVAVSHSGHGLFTAAKIKGMGVVGIPVDYDKEGLERILEDEAVSIFYSVTPDTDGKPLNVNADDFAGFLALWAGAKELIYLNEDGGVLDDDKEVIPEIAVEDIEKLTKDETLAEGKLLKASYAKMLLENGAESVKIAETIFGEGTEFTESERVIA